MRDKEPKLEEVDVSHTRGLYSGRAVPQKPSLPPSEHLLFCHGDSENRALISRIPMPYHVCRWCRRCFGMLNLPSPGSLSPADCGALVCLDQDARRVVSAFCWLYDCELASGAPQASSHVCWWWRALVVNYCFLCLISS